MLEGYTRINPDDYLAAAGSTAFAWAWDEHAEQGTTGKRKVGDPDLANCLLLEAVLPARIVPAVQQGD